MIRKAIILLCFCCVVLCAFIGNLSYQAIQDTQKAVGEAVSMTCEEALQTEFWETSRVKLSDFSNGKYFATVDWNGDDSWESLCVPIFPHRPDFGYGWRAVLIRFKGVQTREEFEKLVESGSLDVTYWPGRQKLDRVVHSQLAQSYKNLDFANSPVLCYGFEPGNPLLGETSLKLSAGVGVLSVLMAFLAVIVQPIKFKRRVKPEQETRPTQKGKRAGPPAEETPSIFDKVTSRRSVMGK